jgi:hypothetical protein
MEDLNKALRRPAGQSRSEEMSDVEADAVGPPATKLREITQEEVANFREQIRWLQNQEHERDNHAEACGVLNIRNLEIPHMEGMFPSATLRHYQPTGIAALISFEDSEGWWRCVGRRSRHRKDVHRDWSLALSVQPAQGPHERACCCFATEGNTAFGTEEFDSFLEAESFGLH